MEAIYSDVDSEEALATEKEAQPLVDHKKDPYVTQPAWIYLQVLGPLLFAFVFPLVFAGYVSINGRVTAPAKLAHFALSNPRTMAQISAIFATSLTATTRLGLSGAAGLLARKRLLHPRRVYEVDMFVSLRNISVIWDWKHRKRMMILSWFLVAVCGFLTSGFLTLFNPIAMVVEVQHPLLEEFDFLKSSPYQATSAAKPFSPDAIVNYPPTLGGVRFHGASRNHNPSAMAQSDIPSHLKALARQYKASKASGKQTSANSFVTWFSGLNSTSVNGSLAGINPNKQWIDSLSHDSASLYGPKYTLDLQGAWLDVSSSKGPIPLDWSLPTDPYPQNMTLSKCPLGEGRGDRQVVQVMELQAAAWGCIWGRGNSMIYLTEYIGDYTAANITCSMTPRIGNVESVFDVGTQTYTMRKNLSTASSIPPETMDALDGIVLSVASYFDTFPLQDLLKEGCNVEDDVLPKLADLDPELIELISSSLFEFEISVKKFQFFRYRKGHSTEPRKVKVVSTQNTVGWEVKATTWLGLVPLLAVTIIAMAMLTWAVVAEGQLTVFDPMSPVSLLGATSVGKVVISNQESDKTVGDPVDENVLNTQVFYAQRDQTWGLWSWKDGDEMALTADDDKVAA